jgi:chaperonin GroES
MKAVGQNVLIKPFSSENISEGGIILADSYKPKRKDKGVVISVGSGSKEKPMLIPTNVVCYHIKGAGVEFEENGELYVSVPQRDILAYELN